MRLIRTTRLLRRQKHTIVHCEIDLCALPCVEDGYLVNLRQGRSGEVWRDSTRTPQALGRERAEALFAQVVAERLAQGFIDPDQSLLPVPAPAAVGNAAVNPQQQAADAILLARLLPGTWKALSPHARTRTIWRIGERRLAGAVPALVGLIETGKPMQDYCIAWAIGRCGDAGAAEAMQHLHQRAKDDAVRRIALHAWLRLAGQEALQAHAQRLIGDWPAGQREAWASQDHAALSTLCTQPGEWSTLAFQDWLEQLDQVALSQPLARALLLEQLGAIPFSAGTFRSVRHIYKAAELREDATLFGLIQQRFDTSQSHEAHGAMVYPSPRHTSAYSDLTRDYLRRRGWRTLRQLGDAADPAYVEMALGVLLAMNDEQAGEVYSQARRHYDQYSHWMVFNRMLRANGTWRPNRSGRSWHRTKPVETETAPRGEREEAFRALWDARPDALLILLQQSRCEGVHRFAARALADNTAYCDTLPVDVLRSLLRSPYRATARLGFALCRARIGSGLPDTGWLMLLLQSNLPEALQYVMDAIGQEPDKFWSDPLLVAALACSADERVRRLGRLLCQCALAEPEPAPGGARTTDAIVLQLLDWLDNCGDLDDAQNVVPAIAADIIWLIDHALRLAAANAPYERVLSLLGHKLASVRQLGGEWLLRHALPSSHLPAATLGALLQDLDPAVRSVGVRLFGALPDHILAAQPDLFASFCTHADAGVRRAIDAALRRVLPAHPALAAALLPALLDALFRAESAESVHADLLAWMQGPFRDAPALSEPALLVRLLASRSKGAQQLGALLLPAIDPLAFSVQDWAQFGRNENASVRAWACAAYSAHPQLVRAHMEQGLRLLDSSWDDSRQFACDFFASQCDVSDWTPTLLVNLCDHLDPTVQRFGQRMLSTHFDLGDVTDYMLKLSQHPSPNMQLFVSAWLESAAAGNAATLARLEPYFLSVLSQVKRGRVVKDRVLDFLRVQADESQETAAVVARIYTRQVLTVAIADKARYIEGLRAIQARYPLLPAHLTIEAPRALAAQRESA